MVNSSFTDINEGYYLFLDNVDSLDYTLQNEKT